MGLTRLEGHRQAHGRTPCAHAAARPVHHRDAQRGSRVRRHRRGRRGRPRPLRRPGIRMDYTAEAVEAPHPEQVAPGSTRTSPQRLVRVAAGQRAKRDDDTLYPSHNVISPRVLIDRRPWHHDRRAGAQGSHLGDRSSPASGPRTCAALTVLIEAQFGPDAPDRRRASPDDDEIEQMLAGITAPSRVLPSPHTPQQGDTSGHVQHHPQRARRRAENDPDKAGLDARTPSTVGRVIAAVQVVVDALTPPDGGRYIVGFADIRRPGPRSASGASPCQHKPLHDPHLTLVEKAVVIATFAAHEIGHTLVTRPREVPSSASTTPTAATTRSPTSPTTSSLSRSW